MRAFKCEPLYLVNSIDDLHSIFTTQGLGEPIGRISTVSQPLETNATATSSHNWSSPMQSSGQCECKRVVKSMQLRITGRA